MRWLSFVRNGRSTYGYVVVDEAGAEGVVDVGAKAEYSTLRQAIAAQALETLPASCGDQADLPLEGLEYAPTITDPAKILCVGLNYKEHQEETGRGGEGFPTVFVRFAAAQMGHLQPMVRPIESATLDFEGEIAMIIGKGGRRISRSNALSHVVGFGIYNDGSVREYQRQTSQFTPGKNFSNTGGFGPWMMTMDEIGDLSQMEITTRLNGEVMQHAQANMLVHGFAELIEYCSTFIDLEPGDVIVTGTPGGVGAARKPPVFMDDGDQIEVEVKPIGILRNPVVGEN
ncbi:fumarylacetoacetate hydrolase family protein [Pseudomonadales bacterium]|jgi:2-keto-4-pentenoate hydratase/2-oxohepta-3-ene-1,7-dioic acid hydratase in catechol pathway|nr:fumarylacetoacetate hydrolase family protein [Pseudomonadales bacterium]MDA8703439.1 fumarylacetoacetate hydrolase family protein [Pseudomonadales bacterium]MDA8952704.1 fumarylacetoacetate hydrolase family protein [Pseudomonadales bacterium]MDA9256933.1 fumarylacetoacetate hydrolase family protein [Pseudomonadales bacterium]